MRTHRTHRPLFEHDCDVCQFIGVVRDDNGKDVDMYVHLKIRNDEATATNFYDLNYVFRESSTPEDYTSDTLMNVPYSELDIPERNPYDTTDRNFPPIAQWEMELIGSYPVKDVTAPFPVSGDMLAQAKKNPTL